MRKVRYESSACFGMTGLFSTGLLDKSSAPAKDLVRQAPVDLDKHLSMHPALQSSNIRDSKFPALSPSGQLRFTGRRRIACWRQTPDLLGISINKGDSTNGLSRL